MANHTSLSPLSLLHTHTHTHTYQQTGIAALFLAGVLGTSLAGVVVVHLKMNSKMHSICYKYDGTMSPLPPGQLFHSAVLKTKKKKFRLLIF